MAQENKKGNTRNIQVSNVVSNGSAHAVMVKADVRNMGFSDITQFIVGGEIFQFESKIPRIVFHLTTKVLMVPRIDLVDIIYIHTT